MYPEVLLGIFTDNGFHFMCHLVCDSDDFFFFACIFTGQNRIAYKSVVKIISFFTAACYNYNRPLICNGEYCRDRGGRGLPPEKVY